MTGLYEFNALPAQVDIKCPHCAARAPFTFAVTRRIERKVDIAYFQHHHAFEYRRYQDSCGGYWHAALYFDGLHGNLSHVLRDLPEGYQAQDWRASFGGGSEGSYVCSTCYTRGKHMLNWPSDAYYALTYKGQLLWAYHREAACDLYAYLSSQARNATPYRWSFFLLHLPTIFKSAKARPEIGKKLKKILLPNGIRSLKSAVQMRQIQRRSA